MGAFAAIQRRLGCVCFVSCALGFRNERVEIVHDEGGMCLAGGPEIIFNADMQLNIFRLKPGAAAFGQFGWFWDFGEAQNFDEESAGFGLLTDRHGELNVVDG